MNTKSPTTMLDRYRHEVDVMLRVTARLSSDGFAAGEGGNAAWKLDDNLLLVTPTQMHKGDITRNDLVFIDRRGKVIEGTRKPTGELAIYLRFFDDRPDIVSMVHAHPPHACALTILEQTDLAMKPYFPEIVLTVGPVPVVPYAQPVTHHLADSFAPYLQRYNTFLMENHGLLTVGRNDVYHTYLMVDLFESFAQSLLAAAPAGRLKTMTRQAVRDLSEVMKMRGYPLVGAPGVNKSLESLYFQP